MVHEIPACIAILTMMEIPIWRRRRQEDERHREYRDRLAAVPSEVHIARINDVTGGTPPIADAYDHAFPEFIVAVMESGHHPADGQAISCVGCGSVPGRSELRRDAPLVLRQGSDQRAIRLFQHDVQGGEVGNLAVGPGGLRDRRDTILFQ